MVLSVEGVLRTKFRVKISGILGTFSGIRSRKFLPRVRAQEYSYQGVVLKLSREAHQQKYIRTGQLYHAFSKPGSLAP